MSFTLWTSGKENNLILKPYQKDILLILDSPEYLSSRDIYYVINNGEHEPASRASVINFLKKLYKFNLIDGTTTTGKGGHRGLYKLNAGETPQIVINKIARMMIDLILIESEMSDHQVNLLLDLLRR